ncbi:HAD family hydrolase [Caballeronia sp. ATUFL_M2_KS44]|uniref:HAD family hydrolase n=1 Tax=Caballeronia sp. ATUFL_M2_KS44 TaxID=2921767 RepID=UPI00202890F5|nr:HAD family hydrolase [Caballeronia sp. ATUFL_M2_KS44]
MTQRTSVVAAFDFDGTITTGDSLKAFVFSTVGVRRFAIAGLLALPYVLGMYIGLCSRARAKATFLRHALKGESKPSLESAAQRFCSARLQTMIRPEMIERIRQHQARGHDVVLVSASPSLYLRIWAGSAGIETVLCTELELDNTGFTGRFVGTNCWGPEKVRRLKNWWGAHPPAFLYAYGDSRGDREMAAASNHAWIRGKGALPPLERWEVPSNTEVC